MKKQYVVFGADRFGASVAVTLEKNGCQVLVIDNNPERVKDIADLVSCAMVADVTDPDEVAELGLKNMDGAVVAIANHMEASIVATLTCRDYGIKEIIARGKNEVHGRILGKIGVSRVVYPEKEMGVRIGHFLTVHDFTDWINLSSDYSLVEFKIPQDWYGKTLGELNLRSRYGFNVVGIRRGNLMDMEFKPDLVANRSMTLYVIGKNTDLEKFSGK